MLVQAGVAHVRMCARQAGKNVALLLTLYAKNDKLTERQLSGLIMRLIPQPWSLLGSAAAALGAAALGGAMLCARPHPRAAHGTPSLHGARPCPVRTCAAPGRMPLARRARMATPPRGQRRGSTGVSLWFWVGAVVGRA